MSELLSLAPGAKFKYEGDTWPWLDEGGDTNHDPTKMPEQEYTVEEYLGYEPAAYIHEPVVVAFDSDNNVYDIPVALIQEYYGICDYCGQKHGPNPIDCPFQRMVD